MAMQAPRPLYPERKADRRTEADDLRMEIRAHEYERANLSRELRWLSRLVMRSVLQQRDDLATEASGRLDYLATRLTRQSDNGGTTA